MVLRKNLSSVTWWAYHINPQICRSCGVCAKVCPSKAIQEPEKGPYWIGSKCSSCGKCLKGCSLRAIKKVFRPKIQMKFNYRTNE